MIQIDSFRGEFDFLSNFSPYGFKDPSGNWWPTNEHWFQAGKCDLMKPEGAEQYYGIMQCEAPGAAKRMGRTVTLTPEWEVLKVYRMWRGITMKFNQNTNIRQKLVETRDVTLIEGNSWGDKFWGQVNGKGTNMLGRLLMELRELYIRIDMENERIHAANGR